MTIRSQQVVKRLKELARAEIAQQSQRFFKTGKGQYGEGDRFLGIRVPALRKLVREYQGMSLQEIQKLLNSPFHEARLFALLLLVHQFKKGASAKQEQIYRLYLDNTRNINNWDLVDSSAPYIVGPFLENRDRQILCKLAKSSDLWERRIAIMSCFYFIRQNDYSDTLILAEQLINDPHDLIHKATGWMLREVGNRDRQVEVDFLNRHYQDMPRTMLRYAIENFSPPERKAYLNGRV